MNSEIQNSAEQTCVAGGREKWPFVELRSYIRRLDKRNSDNSIDAVKGLSVTKQFREPSSKVNKSKLDTYKIVLHDQFAFVQTTNNEKCLVTCLSKFGYPIIVSPVNEVFEIADIKKLLPEYLYLQFKRPEFDRYARFNSWGSARETFNWDDMCRVKIPLPPIEVQQTYVDAYKGLMVLIEENEALLKSLEAAAQAYMVNCREKWPFVELRSYIRRLDKRNSDNSIDAVKGLSVTKQFREPSSKVNKNKLNTYKIVLRDQFAFVQTTNNEKCLVTCLSKFDYPIIVSSVNEVFEIADIKKLLPEYLYLQFKRPEFDRYARFNSWGSVRETFNWDDMCRVKIPLPPIEVQRAIVALYHCAEETRKIAEEAKRQLVLCCPAMIQRAAHQSARR